MKNQLSGFRPMDDRSWRMWPKKKVCGMYLSICLSSDHLLFYLSNHTCISYKKCPVSVCCAHSGISVSFCRVAYQTGVDWKSYGNISLICCLKFWAWSPSAYFEAEFCDRNV